jgi:hypothetical protein
MSTVKAVLILFVFINAVSSAGELRVLSPERTFVVGNGAAAGESKLRDMLSSDRGLCFLLQDTSKHHYHILCTDFIGDTKSLVPLTPGGRASGLAITANGVATILSSERQNIVSQFRADGTPLSGAAVSCYLSEGLLSIGGRAQPFVRTAESLHIPKPDRRAGNRIPGRVRDH